MRRFSKKTIFLIILLFGLFFSLAVLAADLNYGPQTPFPGFQGTVNDKLPITNSSFGEYVAALYKYGVVLGASLAVIVMMLGGIIWLTSAGSADKIGQARAYIGGALGGLVLLLSSYLILWTINPDLVELKSLNIGKIDEIKVGCGWQKTPENNKPPKGYKPAVSDADCGKKSKESNNSCYCVDPTTILYCCGYQDFYDEKYYGILWTRSEKECKKFHSYDGQGGWIGQVLEDSFCALISKPYKEGTGCCVVFNDEKFNYDCQPEKTEIECKGTWHAGDPGCKGDDYKCGGF